MKGIRKCLYLIFKPWVFEARRIRDHICRIGLMLPEKRNRPRNDACPFLLQCLIPKKNRAARPTTHVMADVPIIMNRLCMMLVDILLPDSTAMKRPAIDILITAMAKAKIAGINGFESHMIPRKKGTKTGNAPMTKNIPVVLRDSFG
jgi:hypothetical protein